MWFIYALIWIVGLSLANALSWALGALNALECVYVSFMQSSAIFFFALANRRKFEE